MALTKEPAKKLGSEIGTVIGGPIGRAIHWFRTPSTWTLEARKKYLALGRYSDELKTFPGVLTDADAEELESCIDGKLTAALPGGPPQAEDFGQARLAELLREAAGACARAYIVKVSSSDKWSAEYAALLVEPCVKGG